MTPVDAPSTTRPAPRHVLGVVAALAGLAIATRLVLSTTAGAGDPFDSPLYPWTWLVLPLRAAIASAWRPGAVTPVVFTLALVVPLLVSTSVLGVSDTSGLWGVGLLLDLAQGVLMLVLAYLGALVGHLRRRAGHHPPQAPALTPEAG